MLCVFFISFKIDRGDIVGKITITCDNCGKKFIDYESNHRQYCSRKCKYEYFSHKFDETKTKKCIGCGKEFRSKEKKLQYCSWECYRYYIKQNSYSRNKRKCEWCGKDYYPKQRDQRYCSKDCGYKWYSEFKKTDEQMELQTDKVLNLINSGRTNKAFTKPHVIIDSLLEAEGINRSDEYNIKYYSIDIYLPDSKLMIEIMGDYWHTNPKTKYKECKSIPQQQTVSRDKRKHTYVRNQYGIEILYLWESDIYYKIDLCKMLIAKYISNNGALDNYNSFNYTVQDGKLTLNEDIITPLFLCDKVSQA